MATRQARSPTGPACTHFASGMVCTTSENAPAASASASAASAAASASVAPQPGRASTPPMTHSTTGALVLGKPSAAAAAVCSAISTDSPVSCVMPATGSANAKSAPLSRPVMASGTRWG